LARHRASAEIPGLAESRHPENSSDLNVRFGKIFTLDLHYGVWP